MRCVSREPWVTAAETRAARVWLKYWYPAVDADHRQRAVARPQVVDGDPGVVGQLERVPEQPVGEVDRELGHVSTQLGHRRVLLDLVFPGDVQRRGPDGVRLRGQLADDDMCNMFGYCQVASAYGSGNFINVLHEHLRNHDKVLTSRVNSSKAMLATSIW